MKNFRSIALFLAPWCSGLIFLCAYALAGCGDDDDDNDSDQADDDGDGVGDCTEQVICERNVACGIVLSVEDCLGNIDTCPDSTGFVDCLCTCHGENPDCGPVETCLGQCLEAFCQSN